MKPLISKCSMIPAWHQLVPISGHVEESETARKLQLYATSIKTSVSTRLRPGNGGSWHNTSLANSQRAGDYPSLLIVVTLGITVLCDQSQEWETQLMGAQYPIWIEMSLIDLTCLFVFNLNYIRKWPQIMNSSINKVELLHDFSKITI